MNKGGDTGGIQVYEREVPWHLTSPELPATMRAIFVKIVKNDIGSTSQYLKIGNHFGQDLKKKKQGETRSSIIILMRQTVK